MKKLHVFPVAALLLCMSSCNPLEQVNNVGTGPLITGVILLIVLLVFVGGKFIGRRK